LKESGYQAMLSGISTYFGWNWQPPQSLLL
jgi:hypothetical protein